MVGTLRVFLGTALLICRLIVGAQEPATIDSEPAVRFEQSPGYYHYAAFCRTPKNFTAHLPKPGLLPDQIEFAIGWYVNASVTRAGAAMSETGGRIVVSPQHVRFMPANPKFADHYVDLPRNSVEMEHALGHPDALLRGKDVVVNFHFRKICLTCAPGTVTPAGLNAALHDQEFALLNETITHFQSGWRTTYRMSKGDLVELRSGNQLANRGSTATRENTEPTTSSASPTAIPGSLARPAVSNSNRVANADAPTTPRAVTPAVLAAPKGKTVKIASEAANGLLVRKIPPPYPLEAKLVRLEGTVVLHAIIDKTGEVSQVNALSGPPLLESAAVGAVKQWQYRPYSMNGQSVDVETTIKVVFALDGSHSTARAQNARR